MVTLKQVARACALSVSQTSRALNGYSDVNEETRRRVQEQAQAMGYVKNMYAANLVNRTSNQVMAIVKMMDDDTGAAASSNIFKLLQGIVAKCHELHYEPVIYLADSSNNEEDFVELCHSRYITGAVLYNFYPGSPQLRAVVDSNIPCVTVDLMTEGPTSGCVVVSNAAYSQQAVGQLLDAGCKRVACIAGDKRATVTMERLSGYTIALQIRNMDFDASMIRYCDDFEPSIAKVKLVELLEAHPDIDGLFCMSDVMAVSCMETLEQRGIRVPDDIRVFGFDGILVGQYMRPSLSTIQQDFCAKGKAAVSLLSSIIKGADDAHIRVVSCRVCPRDSSR